MYYYLYEIKNLINGKIYIGVHQTDDIDDEYMGSGKVLKQAIEKYGIESFSKTIIHYFETYEEALDKEKEIVNEDFLQREDVYNLRLGGSGGWDWIIKNNLHKTATGKIPWNKGKPGISPSEETKRKTSETLKEHWKRNPHPRKGKTSWNSGQKGVQTAWNKGKEMPKHPCPKCGKEVSHLNMKRWHGDKCKHERNTTSEKST